LTWLKVKVRLPTVTDTETRLQYRLGHSYRDKGSSLDSEDEFLRIINIPGSGIRNMGGVRPLKFAHLNLPVHAYIILVTVDRSQGSSSNPWEDLVELRTGRIVYWGDAKFGTKTVDDFIGNRALRSAWDQVLDNRRELVPPILHFTKPEIGVMRFNGLCVLDHLELTWFEDQNSRPVRNYRAHMSILDEEFIDVDWLHKRATAPSADELRIGGPPAWQRYQAGKVDRLQIWAPSIRGTSTQLPPAGSNDALVLDQLVAMSPTEFEGAVVSLFRELEDVRHTISRTQPSKDGGFDFFGKFVLPSPVGYEIDFLGEAKKFQATTAVQPKHVSRLVARLGRGQYGLFVTTSYFTKQTQEEVLADGYPTRLIAGADVVNMMRELRIARGSAISPAWLEAVADEMRVGLFNRN
jgi:Restriction endonuclease AspBHI N-terminal/Restriction endonuclease